MESERCHKIYNKYLKKYKEINKEVRSSHCRFNDIAGNLLCCNLYIGTENGEFVKIILALRTYFRLLNKYSNFKEDELIKPEGYFPEFGAVFDKPNFDYKAKGF